MVMQIKFDRYKFLSFPRFTSVGRSFPSKSLLKNDNRSAFVFDISCQLLNTKRINNDRRRSLPLFKLETKTSETKTKDCCIALQPIIHNWISLWNRNTSFSCIPFFPYSLLLFISMVLLLFFCK